MHRQRPGEFDHIPIQKRCPRFQRYRHRRAIHRAGSRDGYGARQITTGEWQRLELAPAPARAAWARELERIWTDVASGDNVTAVVLPGKETVFFDSRGVLGHVRDPDFGPAFLRIWLDSRTAIQDLRAQLLGGAGESR